MAIQWVVSIVELSVPTEKTVGPFTSAQEASDWLDEARLSGRWEREQWQRVGALELHPPESD
jgi:hypothetical protein